MMSAGEYIGILCTFQLNFAMKLKLLQKNTKTNKKNLLIRKKEREREIKTGEEEQ